MESGKKVTTIGMHMWCHVCRCNQIHVGMIGSDIMKCAVCVRSAGETALKANRVINMA